MHHAEIEVDSEVEVGQRRIWMRQRANSLPQLSTTRTLCKRLVHFHLRHVCIVTTDHDTEDCPTLLGKIQEKRNQNNQNVQWILAEARDDGKNINIVTRGGAKMGVDATKQDPTQHQWVKKNTEPHKHFDAQKEKEMFKEARHEILKENIASTSIVQQSQDPPLYEMPPFNGSHQQRTTFRESK
jgi:hypothetical protein